MKMKLFCYAASTALICGLFTQSAKVNAAPPPPPGEEQPPPVPSHDVWVTCTPTEVGTFSQRITISCAESFSGGISSFAYIIGTGDVAARYMSMATSALISGRNVKIKYNPAPDKKQLSDSCNSSNCRYLLGLVIVDGANKIL